MLALDYSVQLCEAGGSTCALSSRQLVFSSKFFGGFHVSER